MSNEVHFHLNETVNKQNLSYWAPQHPHLIHLHSEKEVTIWCAIGIIGPNFLKRIGLHLLLIRLDTLVCLKPELRRQQIR